MVTNEKAKELFKEIKTILIDRGRCIPIVSKPDIEVLKCPDGLYILRSTMFSIVIEKDKKVEVPLD